MNIKKLTKLCSSLVLSLVLSVGQFVPAYAFTHDGSNVQGIQVGEKFYSIGYINTHEAEFENIFGPADRSTVIIDFNGKSAKFSDYLSSGVADFDEFASVAANQTQANPGKLVKADGTEVALSSGGDGGDTGGDTEKTVSSILAVSNTSVEVTFSSALETADYAKEKFTFSGGLTVSSAAIKSGSSNKIVVLTTSAQTGGTAYALTYSGTATGKSFTGLASNAPAKPNVTGDISNGTLSGLNDTMEYSTDGGGTWTTYDSANQPTGLKGEVQIRVKATSITPAGAVTVIEFPSDVPAAPSVSINTSTGTLSGMNATMEYKIGSGSWTSYDFLHPPTKAELTGQTVQVRVKANGSTPAGEITTLDFSNVSVGEHIKSINIEKSYALAIGNYHRVEITTSSEVGSVKVEYGTGADDFVEIKLDGHNRWTKGTIMFLGKDEVTVKVYSDTSYENLLESKKVDVN